MKNILLLLILACMAFVSCDGRKSKSVSLKESIKEFKERQSDLEIINYYPNEYVEVVTDTIISNELKIHIKNYSLANETIFMSIDENATPKIQKQHRIFESEIVISTATKEIFSAHISAEQFKSYHSDQFWTNATLQHVWVNQELSTSNDVKLDMSFINPKNNSYKLYRMSIDLDGKQQLELIEEKTS